MNKSVLLGLAALALTATSVSAQEVTYEPDCSQGLLLNRNADNWFITAQGGSNILMATDDIHAELKNRFGWNAGLYVGKWVSPVFGFRFGATWEVAKGATTQYDWFRNYSQGAIDSNKEFYPEKWMGLGPEFDVMVNLTNWWCGYRPGRVYNAVVHGGANAYWRWRNVGTIGHSHWKHAKVTNLSANVGIQNNFNISKRVALFLDVQYEILDFTKLEHDLQLFAGITVNLGKTTWNCPVTAVCPTWKYTDAEGDALVARLNSADNQIKNLMAELDACMKRPTPKAQQQVVNCEGLATVYFPINQYGLSLREKTILKSVAEVMKNHPEQKYTLTGWADNYTGNDQINTNLRNKRVDGVKAYLVACGVNADQLNATIDANNLTDFGIKGAPLDRAVTIKVAD